MQPNAPLYYTRHYTHPDNFVRFSPVGSGHANGDFLRVRVRVRWHEVRKLVHGPCKIVQPAMRVAGREFRLGVPGEFLKRPDIDSRSSSER